MWVQKQRESVIQRVSIILCALFGSHETDPVLNITRHNGQDFDESVKNWGSGWCGPMSSKPLSSSTEMKDVGRQKQYSICPAPALYGLIQAGKTNFWKGAVVSGK